MASATLNDVTPASQDDNDRRDLIEAILTEYARTPYAYGDVAAYPVFDRARARFLVLTEGWMGYKRVHGVIIHVDIINGKFWIQYDGTEKGIATELVEAGVPKDEIVLAFKPELRRELTDFAVS